MKIVHICLTPKTYILSILSIVNFNVFSGRISRTYFYFYINYIYYYYILLLLSPLDSLPPIDKIDKIDKIDILDKNCTPYKWIVKIFKFWNRFRVLGANLFQNTYSSKNYYYLCTRKSKRRPSRRQKLFPANRK